MLVLVGLSNIFQVIEVDDVIIQKSCGCYG